MPIEAEAREKRKVLGGSRLKFERSRWERDVGGDGNGSIHE